MNEENFRKEIERLMRQGRDNGLKYLDIKAGDLHKSVGGYPGHNHRMPVCCNVMYSIKKETDEILSAPPKGKGASLVIRYYL